MKKVFAIAAALMMLATAANAQSFGAGYVQSTQKTGNHSATANGFYAGFGYSAEIMPGLSLNPGLYYEFLSSTSAGSLWFVSGESKTQEHYVNVPLHLSYGINFAPTFKVFVYGGPTANVGIASTTKSKVSIAGHSSDVEPINNYDDDDYSRFDIMLGAGAGVEVMKKFRVTVGYDWGMLDRFTDDDLTLKRNRLTAGAAFIF
ncbi:MAG: PorT family protein [Bacteroidales bacterium]|nr:PorT family protein [Bacteroidales bacterium]